MPFPAAETLTKETFAPILRDLERLIKHLPAQLPSPDIAHSRYRSFLSFSLDAEILDKTGCEVATLGEQLEHVFGWNARTSGDGIIPILERGVAIQALPPILTKYHERHSENNVLKKWVVDLANGAEKVFKTYGVPVRFRVLDQLDSAEPIFGHNSFQMRPL